MLIIIVESNVETEISWARDMKQSILCAKDFFLDSPDYSDNVYVFGERRQKLKPGW